MGKVTIVVDNIRKVEGATEKALKRAARIIGGVVEGYAKDLCPVDTGLLRNSITFALGGEPPNIQTYKSNDKDKNGKPIEPKEGKYEGQAQDDEKNQVTVYVGTNVHYAPYQELGAPNINLGAQPFLRPAFEDHRQDIEEIYERELKKL